MATRVESFTVTIPAGTAKSAPVTVNTSFNPGQVDEIDIEVPPGPSGLMGFQLAYGSQAVIPHDPSQFIVTDNRDFNWPLTDFPTGDGWSVIGYNTDIYDHIINVHYLITEIGLSGTQPESVNISASPAEIVLASSATGA